MPCAASHVFTLPLNIHGHYAVVRHLTMRKTLRRSCDACAKSKLSCDLRTPQCSRCLRRKSVCVYVNQPLTSSLTVDSATFTRNLFNTDGAATRPSTNTTILLNNPGVGLFDPFDSYPQTRLPRTHVQRLIQHCKSALAFLDCSSEHTETEEEQFCQTLSSNTIPWISA